MRSIGARERRTGVFERRLSIKARLSLSLLAVMVLVLPVTALSLIYLNDMLRTVDRMAHVDVRTARIAQDIETYVLTARDAEKNYLIFRDPMYMERNREGMNRVSELIATGLAVSDASWEELEQIRRFLKSYVTTFDLLVSKWFARPGVSAIRRMEEDPEVMKLLADLNDTGDEMTRLSSEIALRSWDRMDVALEEVGRSRARAERNILTILMLTVLGGLYLIVVLPRRVVLPVRRLTNVIRQIEEEGDLGASTERVSHDELGDMAHAFNRMMERIRTFDALKVQKIAELHGRLEMLSDEISEGVLVVEPEGTITFANEKVLEMTGWSGKDAVGNPIHRVDEGGPLSEAVAESLRTLEPVSERRTLLRGAGREAKLSIRPVRSREGHVLSVVVLVRE